MYQAVLYVKLHCACALFNAMLLFHLLQLGALLEGVVAGLHFPLVVVEEHEVPAGNLEQQQNTNEFTLIWNMLTPLAFNAAFTRCRCEFCLITGDSNKRVFSLRSCNSH